MLTDEKNTLPARTRPDCASVQAKGPGTVRTANRKQSKAAARSAAETVPAVPSQRRNGAVKAARTQSTKAVAKEYSPSAKDTRLAADLQQRMREHPKFITLAVDNAPSGLAIREKHADSTVAQVHLLTALGITDPNLYRGVINDLCNLANDQGQNVSERELNNLVAVVRSVAPRDQLETLLAVQMAAVHTATIRTARSMRRAEFREQLEAYSTSLNKLTRTFAVQIDTLKRYRSTGEQNVRVTHQHVTVNNQGGQAVVAGKISSRGGDHKKTEDQSHGPSTSGQPSPAMLGNVETVAVALPGTGGEGQTRVLVSRREGRSTAGKP